MFYKHIHNKYLKISAPSWSPIDRKSLLALMGLSPLHKRRPSLAVLLKRMKRLVLEPDNLKNTDKVTSKSDYNQNCADSITNIITRTLKVYLYISQNILQPFTVTSQPTFSGYLCCHMSGNFGQWTVGFQWLQSQLGRENIVFTL